MATYLDIDIVQAALRQSIEHAQDQVARLITYMARSHVDGGNSKIGSPIEAVFEIAFSTNQVLEQSFELEQQVEIEANGARYRFDFQVALALSARERTLNGPSLLPLAVEIDGHAFHEKTLEQVTYRNKRDRDVQTAGIKIFHFSYSELVGDPMFCAELVTEEARKLKGKAV